MSKTFAAALLGAAILTSTALPAMAESVSSCRSDPIILPDGTKVERVDYYAKSIATQLRQQGYNVDYVENWGGCVKAFINDPKGGQHMEYFDPDTLQELTR